MRPAWAWLNTPNSFAKPNRPGAKPGHQLKDQTMRDKILDILAALVIAALLLVGALAYFDVLTK